MLELLHGVEGKVADEMGARVWMRGKWGEKGDGAVADGFSSGPVARGREGKRGGGPTGAAMWRRRRDEGGLAQRSAARSSRQWPPAVGRGRRHCRSNREGGGAGDAVWAAVAWA
jgi:hypothetical protein